MTENVVVKYELPGPDAVVLADTILEQSRALVIDSHSMLEMALDERAAISRQLGIIETERMAITRPIDAGKKAVMDFFKKLTTPRESAIAVIDTAVRTWRTSEAKRLALETAEREAQAKAEQARLVAEAEKATAAGDIEKATALVMTAEMVTAMPVEAPAKVAGTVFSKTWVGQVTDVPAFLRYVADHMDRANCIEFKQAELNGLARSVKDVMSIPGFTATERESIASRGAKE